MSVVIRWIHDRRKILAAYIITGLLIYSEQIVLELPNADALLNSTIEKSSFKWELQLGRFMLPLYQMLFGYTISPALVTIIAILVLSVSTLIITEILPFQDNKVRYLAGVFVLVSPHVQSLLTYYYCSAAYSISMLLACLAVLLLCKKDFKLWNGIAAVVLYALSLGGYQSYLFTAATLSLMVLIFSVVQGETPRNLWKKFLRLLIGGAAGVALYLVLNQAALLRIHISNVDNRGFSTMGQLDWKGLPWRIFLYVYHYNKEYFFGDELINNSYGIVPRRYLNLTFFVFAIAVVLIYFVWKKGKLRRKFAACLMMFLIPFGTVSLYLCAPELSILETTGSLAASAFFLVYVFVLAFADNARTEVFTESVRIPWRIMKAFSGMLIAVASLVLLMYGHMAQDGQAYLRYEMNQTKAVAQSVSTEILRAEKKYGTDQVFVACHPSHGNYDDRYSNLRDSVHWLVTSYGVMWETNAAQTCFRNMCGDYIGFTYERPDSETCDRIRTTQEFAGMPCYPEEGSVRMIDDVIVVKLSED